MIIYFSKEFLKHEEPYGRHPESPERLRSALKAIKAVLGDTVRITEPERIDERLPELIHSVGYVEFIRQESMKGFHYIDTDTYVNEHTFTAALTAINAAWEAGAKALETGEPVLVLARPPGHHAGFSGTAMNAPSNGFCIFNNAAACIKRFLDHGFRVAVLDFDAHHGNGTQEIFWCEPRVLHIDIHEWETYPGTGWFTDRGGEGAEGSKVNIPMPHYAGDGCYQWVLSEVVFKAIDSFDPDAIVVSAGFDPYVLDPLTTLRVTNRTFKAIGNYLRRRLRGRVKAEVIVLEGGYGKAIAEGIKSFIEGLSSEGPVEVKGSLDGVPRWFVEGVRKYLMR